MSTSRYQHVYKCWNDCQPSGCPSHVAYLTYQSVSNSLHFYTHDGQEVEMLYMQTPELEAFLSMLYKIARSHVEIETCINNAQKQLEDK
jgi:hypothetical protein